MNIVYIIGNGFDKAQGLDTCYADFYDKYKNLPPDSELEARVKDEIQENYPTWADMEIGMGQYSSKWDDVNDFRKVIKLLNKRLKYYLLDQESRLAEMSLSREKLVNDILDPIAYLDPANRMRFLKLVDYSHPFQINWVTFNYTITMETVMGSDQGVLRTSPGIVDVLQSTLHIHGVLREKTVLGVNDAGQIANESFQQNDYLKFEFVKPMYNEGCQNGRDSRFISLISNADVIVLMGTSVGVTDSFWWKMIGQWLATKSSRALLYFPYDSTKDTVEDECFKGLWSEEYIVFLRERMGLDWDVKLLKNKVFCGINTDFLKLCVSSDQ